MTHIPTQYRIKQNIISALGNSRLTFSEIRTLVSGTAGDIREAILELQAKRIVESNDEVPARWNLVSSPEKPAEPEDPERWDGQS